MNADKMLNQKGMAAMLLMFIGLVGVLGLFFVIYRFWFLNTQSSKSSSTPQISASPSSVSTNPEEDSSYNLVKREYNLNQEQLEILSRVDSNDNRF